MKDQFPVDEAVKAQRALRDAAGLTAECFSVEAFVGMISDEIEVLREMGKSDEQIAWLVREHSAINISAEDILNNYVSSEDRNRHQR